MFGWFCFVLVFSICGFLGVEEECDVSMKLVDACFSSEKLIPFVMGVNLCYINEVLFCYL